jgi:sugar lactone lactonase YvrE
VKRNTLTLAGITRFGVEKIVKTTKWSATQSCIGLIAFAVLLATNLQAQVNVTTVAGGFVNDGQSATNAGFLNPQFVSLDGTGNLYITDIYNHRVREVSNGTISTFAGTGFAGFGHTGGPCIQPNIARIRFPRGVVADPGGTVYFSDSGNQRIKKVTPGCMHVYAGNGNGDYSGDDHIATSAALDVPNGLALDSAGNLYIADYFNSVVRVVDTLGYIHTVAGNGTAGYSGDNGPATAAQLNLARGVWVDASNNLYIADTNNLVVRKVTPWTPGAKHTINPGTITTIAGNGSNGCAGDGGLATAAPIGPLRDVAVSNGTLFISNGGCDRIRAVDLSSNVITTYAGSSIGYDGEGNPPLSAKFSTPMGLGFDLSGNLLVVDSGNSRVRRVTSTAVNTIAGGYTGDGGPANKSALTDPENVAFDQNRNMYIVEANGNRIRKISTNGTITTFAGTGITGYSGDGGAATSATLNNPLGVAADSKNNVYIADNNNGVIRVVSKGKISTFSANAGFGSLASLVTDSSGNVYAADQGACVVWKVTPSAVVSIVAGELSNCGYNSDGVPATSALLNSPYGVAFDSAGDLLIGDTNNQRVRMVNTAGIISTVAGTGTCGYSGDGGQATLAQVCKPKGVAVGASGNLYIADWNNAVIRLVNSGGVIQTLAGSGLGSGYNGDNLPALRANLDGPVAIAIKPVVNVPFFVDDQSYRVRQIR